MSFTIRSFKEEDHQAVLAVSMRSWAPVFADFEPAVAPHVFNAFYPHGWRARQSAEIEDFLKAEAGNVWVAMDGDALIGWVGIRLHYEDSMGEIYILAVEPDAQRQGVGRALIDKSFEQMRNAGLSIVMVETGDDPGHASSRLTYESIGFERWPVARYFREL
jgi:GNAT superfamily N-acetyltransferase